MKKALGMLAVIGIVFLVVCLWPKRSVAPIVPVADVTPLVESRAYCFVYSHAATPDAPYAVEEHLTLTRVRGAVTGTKRGTQAGPDMTNGYEGTESGTWTGERLELVYDYVIEGSHQRELELYTIDGGDLVKHRFALTDAKRDGVPILIPDETTAPTLLTYTAEPCSS